ncbi:MAG: hypothetical protein IT425_12690 [Pirellulales bacterium]|nr:hypothetical protein [Pirellulales bacterium]
MKTHRQTGWMLFVFVMLFSCAVAEEPPTAGPPAAADELSVEQARLADRYKRLEEVVGRLAELSASTDPRRAKLLREAIAQSREQDINVRFEAVVNLLQDERLSAASTNQTELQKELDSLLTLLLKADRENELSSQRDRVKKYLKEVSRLIREQKGVRARTEGGDELKQLGADQQRLSADTGKLGGSITETEGVKKDGKPKPSGEKGSEQPGKDSNQPPGGAQDKPKKEEGSSPKQEGHRLDQPNQQPDKPAGEKQGEPSGGQSTPSQDRSSEGQPSQDQQGSPSQPGQGSGEQQPGGQKPSDQGDEQKKDPADRAGDQLKKARQQMEEALKKLEEAERKGAADRQRQAIKELELAKAELERVLRQLREEELERTLTQLAARFRRMLELQVAVYEGTVRVDKVPAAQRTHDHEIESARLSREESRIVHEVDKALALLREEGSSVAFPEAVEQMRDDMRQVVERLAATKVDSLTQSIEQDIIAALEETIAALDKAAKDLEQKRTPPGQQPPAGQPGEMPLVDPLAELKMIRALQLRINQRTIRYGQMIQGEQAENAELLKSLQDLADRQARVYQATADLQKEKND